MTVIADSGEFAIVRLALTAQEIPGLLVHHANNYPGGSDLELAGSELIASEFEPGRALSFVENVCTWGRGQRLIGRVSSYGAIGISNVLKSAVETADAGDIAAAVVHIQTIPYLGQSFASKQLRFLAPTRAVILDSVIRSRLGYLDTAAGYAEFLSDCWTILERVRTSFPAITMEDGSDLRICDIEAAIFAKLQGFEA